jgi:hypothetical protein
MNTQSPLSSGRFFKVAGVLCWVVAGGLVLFTGKHHAGDDPGVMVLLVAGAWGFALAGYVLLRRAGMLK